MNLKNAWIYRTEEKRFVKGGLCTENGRIVGFEEEEDALDLGGALVIPGLIDIHTHGRAGTDFVEATSETLKTTARSFASVGTTTVIPTLASAEFDELLAAIRALGKTEEPGEGECRFLGVHLEGRYLSSARRGTHAPRLLHLPSVEEVKRLLEACGGRKLRISMAPELPCAEEVFALAKECSIQIGIAHTDATFEQAMEAVERGADVFAHQFNAMRPFHHRDPGTVGAGLLSDAYIELICDGFHLHPGTVLLAQKCKSPDKVVLITDSMAGAGCPDGAYSIAGQPVTVKDGKAIAQDGAIAGSTLNLLDGLKNYAAFCGLTLEEAIPAATINPARCAGIADSVGSLEVGKYADFLVLSADRNEHLATAVGGELIWK